MTRPLLILAPSLLAILCRTQKSGYFWHETEGSDGGIVGKTDDEFQVTPTGQVSYEIPYQHCRNGRHEVIL